MGDAVLQIIFLYDFVPKNSVLTFLLFLVKFSQNVYMELLLPPYKNTQYSYLRGIIHQPTMSNDFATNDSLNVTSDSFSKSLIRLISHTKRFQKYRTTNLKM